MIVSRTAHIKVNDRVETKSGRKGRVKSLTNHGDVATVLWDDGEEFAIKVVHLSLIEMTSNVGRRRL